MTGQQDRNGASAIAADLIAADEASNGATSRDGKVTEERVWKKGAIPRWAQPLPTPQPHAGRSRTWAALLGAVLIVLLGLGAVAVVLVNRGGTASIEPPGAGPGEAPVRGVDTPTATATATPPPPDSAEPSASQSGTVPPRTGSAVPPVTTDASASPSSSPSSPGLASSPTSTSTPTPTPTPTPTVPPLPSTSPSPAAPLNTGTYQGTITVLSDRFGHAAFIGPMPVGLDVLFTRGVITGTVTITISGAPPWIPVKGVGTFNATNGAFTATGSGTVTSNQIPVTAEFAGTLKDGVLAGNLTLTGTPNGGITYHAQMIKQ